MARTWKDWLFNSVRKTGNYDLSGIDDVVSISLPASGDYVVSKTSSGVVAKEITNAETDPVFSAEKNKLIALSIVL